MHGSTNPDVGNFIVFQCAICNATGLATTDEELVPEGPCIHLCRSCKAAFEANTADTLIYCMTCRRITHIVKPGDKLEAAAGGELGDRVMFVRDCRESQQQAYRRSELDDIGPDADRRSHDHDGRVEQEPTQ